MVLTIPRRLAAPLLALAYCLIIATPAAMGLGQEPPSLMIIEYRNLRDRLSVEVPLSPGLVPSPHQGKSQRRIAILPGDALRASTRPPDRSVNLYRGVNEQRILLCVIQVRYYRTDSERWLPRFQLYQEPTLVRDGDGWKPAATALSAPGLIVRTSSTLPNAQGYFRSLEFGLTNGPIFVDAWQVL